MKYCTKCLMPETRPRITFNSDGVCNACQWNDEKKTIDWTAKRKQLEALCSEFRAMSHGYNVLVPCSGGKDGSYVAWKLKHELGMNPLCFTLEPQIQTEIGRLNLNNFKAQGFDHILVSPDKKKYQQLSKEGFIERGQPKEPFINGITTVAARLSKAFEIPLVMLGEEGETEYGGTSAYKDRMFIDNEYLHDCYYSGNEILGDYWFSLPDIDNVFFTHWSKFEDWDPEQHARFCSKHTGLQMSVGGQIGTFTNYAQLDDALQDLHAFMMFVKFGFGRATSDCSIEIRRGRMTREEGKQIVDKVDGQFPLEYLPLYLDYFGMTEEEFWKTVDRHSDKSILEKEVFSWKNLSPKPYVLRNNS